MEKSTRVSVRISDTDMERIRNNADKIHMTVSEYIRSKAVQEMEQVLFDPEIREALFEALFLLREMGCYIHEMGHGTVQEEHFKDLNQRLSDIVDSLRDYLKGRS